jgi:hypothetical protein
MGIGASAASWNKDETQSRVRYGSARPDVADVTLASEPVHFETPWQTTSAPSRLIGEENPVSRNLKGFCRVPLDIDLDYLPSFSFSINKAAPLRNGSIAVHVEVDLVGRWISVVPKDDLLSGFHATHPVRDMCWELPTIGRPPLRAFSVARVV